MAKKKRLSDDAFTWVKDTSTDNIKADEEKKKPLNKSNASEKSNGIKLSNGSTVKEEKTDSGKKRDRNTKNEVQVWYKNDGTIISIGRVRGNITLYQSTEGTKVSKVAIPQKMIGKDLAEIHKSYIVKIDGNKVSLVTGKKFF